VALNQHECMHSHWFEEHKLEGELSVHRGIMSEVNKVQFVSDRSSYIMLRCCWCETVLNVHVPAEGSFNEELEPVFY
jgi:hypothetical protein